MEPVVSREPEPIVLTCSRCGEPVYSATAATYNRDALRKAARDHAGRCPEPPETVGGRVDITLDIELCKRLDAVRGSVPLDAYIDELVRQSLEPRSHKEALVA